MRNHRLDIQPHSKPCCFLCECKESSGSNNIREDEEGHSLNEVAAYIDFFPIVETGNTISLPTQYENKT